MNLILLDPGEVDGAGLARLSGRRAAHARAVLAAAPGQRLRVGVLGGRMGSAIVERGAGETLELRVELTHPPPPPCGIDLLLALPRPKSLRRILAAAASLGVKRIVLVRAARVEKSYFDSPLLAPPRLEAELRLGLEQACDTILPEVRIEPLFRPFVEDRIDRLWAGAPLRLLADPGAERPRDDLAGRRAPAVLAVGPDGGWVPFERELLAARGFHPFTLGPRRLRSDTAVVALLAALGLARGLAARAESAGGNGPA